MGHIARNNNGITDEAEQPTVQRTILILKGESVFMKLAIMQPYLFPYIGYFQLINAVDKFIIADDVQYINKGWINRNRILIKGKEHLFTLSIKKAPFHFNINQRHYIDAVGFQKKKLLNTIRHAYSKAPFYDVVMDLLVDIFADQELNVSTMITNSLKSVCLYIGIKPDYCLSSELARNNSLSMEESTLDINKCMGSDNYINQIGGVKLYSKEKFVENHIKLNFLKTKEIPYKQFSNDFVPNLSIIDVLMFNSKIEVQRLLNEYELI